MKKYQKESLIDIKAWTKEDAGMANFEGWCISNTSKNNIVISRLDDAKRFKDDEEASLFVMDQFLKGNGLAAKAIYYLINGLYEIDHPDGW